MTLWTPLVVEPLPDGRRWRLREAFELDYHGFLIHVPRGFTTDFASIPRPFWGILPPWGRYGKAAVLHDWLYYSGRASRVVADAVFCEAMASLKVGRLTRWVIYAAVRIGGGAAWRAHRRAGHRE
jgi:hypothetical protein